MTLTAERVTLAGNPSPKKASCSKQVKAVAECYYSGQETLARWASSGKFERKKIISTQVATKLRQFLLYLLLFKVIASTSSETKLL